MKLTRGASRPTAPSTLGALVIAVVTAFAPAEAAERPDCVEVGTWVNPASGSAMASDELLSAMARRSVVLLGESHDNAEHHR